LLMLKNPVQVGGGTPIEDLQISKQQASDRGLRKRRSDSGRSGLQAVG
jgi:hypothetical protein